MAEGAQKNIGTWYIDPDAEDRMADGHAPIWRHLIELIPERDLTDKSVLDFGCNQGACCGTSMRYARSARRSASISPKPPSPRPRR